jgi:predicted DNA-binding transcriptional regulator YafY
VILLKRHNLPLGVDEIAMDSVTSEEMFLQVKEVLKQISEPARIKEVNTDSNSEPTKVYSAEEAEICVPPLDETKQSSLDETDAQSREDKAAKAIASLHEKATVEDTATIEVFGEPPSKDQPRTLMMPGTSYEPSAL